MKVGIDFGTSTSEIAYVESNGNITVIPNHLGEVITPSVVYYADDGTVKVGLEAKEQALLEPENTVLEVKRLFGSTKKLNIRGRELTPVQVAADIIRYLRDCAQKHTGTDINSAVVTVPAYFSDNQRKEVMAAGFAAGLEVDRIINEPTSASLDYGVKNMQNCEHILVYDLGGGTLDVSVLELFEGVVEVKSSSGNNALGGKDFDQAIINHISSAIKNKDKIDVLKDPRAAIRIKIAAETCKIALSTKTEYEIELPFLYTKKDNPAGYQEVFKRELFEDLIADMVGSTKEQIESALYDAKLEPSEIDLVLLVGGSSHIPYVTNFLSKIFGSIPRIADNADLAVVRGAAIQAGVIDGVLNENAIALTDVCPYSLSTDVLVGEGFFGQVICDVLIPRNTTLPTEVSKMYATSGDDQTSVGVMAYQGESSQPEENILLNSFTLGNIPKGRAGKETINVTFAYDLNGILTISAEVVSTGKSTTVTVDTTAAGENLDLALWKKSPLAKIYRKLINKGERLLKLHNEGDYDTLDIERFLDELKRSLILEWDEDTIGHIADNLSFSIEEFE